VELRDDRRFRLIQSAVDLLELDLGGAVVLTEMGTGFFQLTPLLAAAAGASKVLAVAKDSRYGSSESTVASGMDLAKRWGLDNHVEPVTAVTAEHLAETDVVTNLGFVRPIDARFVSAMKTGSVVAHMCEAWEIRPEDVDVAACRANNVPVMGVCENDERLQVFDYCGLLVVKMLFEAGVEIRGNRILVLSGDAFGRVIESALRGLGAQVTVLTRAADLTPSLLSCLDAVVPADYSSKEALIGSGGWLEPKVLKEASPGCVVVPLAGCVDTAGVLAAGLFCSPAESVGPRRMTRTLAHLGPRPLIYLHAGGLKVGELLWREMRVRGCAAEVETHLAQSTSLCQPIGEG
jgi:hypothetical protein